MAGALTGVDVFGPESTGGTTLSGQFLTGYFGDGSDGDFIVSVSHLAAREMHYDNLTIPAGYVYKPNGHRIFVKGTLTIDATGSFNDDGLSSTSQAGATGLGSRNYLGGFGGQGGNGQALTATGLLNGFVGTAATNTSLNNTGAQPTGGQGGSNTLRTGGLAGAATQPTPNQKWNGAASSTARFSAGAFGSASGGGGGAINVTAYTSGTFISGGGGSGGGIVWIAAKTIINSGRISANGGNGFNGLLAVGSAECSGGGGGGGGNVAIITTTPLASLGTVQVNGGTGGTGVFNTGAVTPGINGNNGSLFTLIVS